MSEDINKTVNQMMEIYETGRKDAFDMLAETLFELADAQPEGVGSLADGLKAAAMLAASADPAIKAEEAKQRKLRNE